jgi:hypothetical protein
LVTLYSRAFQLTKDPLYKKVVYETLEFIERELTSPELPGGGRGFYSSLDADSEGEEGKFYTWTKQELEKILGKEAGLIIDYYNVTDHGNWERGKNILFRSKTDQTFAKEYKYKLSVQDLQKRVAAVRRKLLDARSKKTRPPLDDKILTSWNALMLIGYVDAYRVFDDNRFLEIALKNARFIEKNMLSNNGRLNRNFKEDKSSSSINAFLEDYAFTIKAFISLYQATFDETWLFKADHLLKYALNHFYDKKSGMFYYTSDLDPQLIARKIEITDNVIPASNSIMANNLYLLGEYFYKEEYINISKQMLNNVKPALLRNGIYFANWSILKTYFIEKPLEVAILGKNCLFKRKELDNHYLPNIILMGGKREGKLPILKNKPVDGQTTIYVCKNKACMFPVKDTEKAIEQIKKI